jgi:hypothetical protein
VRSRFALVPDHEVGVVEHLEAFGLLPFLAGGRTCNRPRSR